VAVLLTLYVALAATHSDSVWQILRRQLCRKWTVGFLCEQRRTSCNIIGPLVPLCREEDLYGKVLGVGVSWQLLYIRANSFEVHVHDW